MALCSECEKVIELGQKVSIQTKLGPNTIWIPFCVPCAHYLAVDLQQRVYSIMVTNSK